MFTSLKIENFKRFRDFSIDLGNPVAFVGPNNSGKTSVLHAIALWSAALQVLKRYLPPDNMSIPSSGVLIPLAELSGVAVPFPDYLWHNRKVDAEPGADSKAKRKSSRKNQVATPVRVSIEVGGADAGEAWRFALDFALGGDLSKSPTAVLCLAGSQNSNEEFPAGALEASVVFISLLSGLALREFRLDEAAVYSQLSEGHAGEVLRNLCYLLYNEGVDKQEWRSLVEEMQKLFGITMLDPVYYKGTGVLEQSYTSSNGTGFDIAAAGAGMIQTLLLLVVLRLHRNTVVLIDEPDAHMEIVRQREIMRIIAEIASANRSQVIFATHSADVLKEIVDRGQVIACIGDQPRILSNADQSGLHTALRNIEWSQYYLAERFGWVLYLEGLTDAEILRAFAERLAHPSVEALRRPNVYTIGNVISNARVHYKSMKLACPRLEACMLIDRQEKKQTDTDFASYMWQRNEIENYLCSIATLHAYAEQLGREVEPGAMLQDAMASSFKKAMQESINYGIAEADRNNPGFWLTTKASDDILGKVLPEFAKRTGTPILNKGDYYRLVSFIPEDEISDEIKLVLDMIHQTASRANGWQWQPE